MRYFLDTEFIEGFKKPIKWLPTIGSFNKPYHSIQLISIGIKAEDEREYYAVSSEYNYSDASDWVKKNVIVPIYQQQLPAFKQRYMDIETFHKHIPDSKTSKQIACEVLMFVFDGDSQRLKSWNGFLETFYNEMLKFEPEQCGEKRPEFYAYYADYDWVVLCSLFGTMMDLPKGFPMYCRDIKQMIDEYVSSTWEGYPQQTNEHNALDDAKFNFELFKFLQALRG